MPGYSHTSFVVFFEKAKTRIDLQSPELSHVKDFLPRKTGPCKSLFMVEVDEL